MNPLLLTLIPSVLDKFFPSSEKRQEFETELAKMDIAERTETLNFLVKMNEGQSQINLENAKDKESLLNSGWRPYLCWGLATATLWTMFGYNIFHIIWTLAVDPSIPVPPNVVMDKDFLFELLTAMLGLAGLRSHDKVKNIT